MRIKENKRSFFSKANVQILVGMVIILGLLMYVQYNKPQEYEFASEEVDELESTFTLNEQVDLEDVLTKNRNRIYQEENLSIYVFQNNEIP